MNGVIGFCAIFCLVACAHCFAAPPDAASIPWPALPEADGEVMISAQEWPFEPGPREVKVYLRYPGGRIENVTGVTGLMLTLHNWGGTGYVGTADPERVTERYNVIAIGVDYLQSGPYEDEDRAKAPYDFGYLQALDALRALYYVGHALDAKAIGYARGRIYCTGGSGGGNVTLMANKLAPRTFACAVDMCGMAKLADDIAYGIPGRTRLNAGYSRDAASAAYLAPDAQALRFVGHPDHARIMKKLGNTAKLIVIHGVDDPSCPCEDAKEMVENLQAAGLDVEPHYVTPAEVDGTVFTSTGHAFGDRTLSLFRVADGYLTPGSPSLLVREGPSDFELRDAEVRYPTPNGAYVISYETGYPIGRFVVK